MLFEGFWLCWILFRFIKVKEAKCGCLPHISDCHAQKKILSHFLFTSKSGFIVTRCEWAWADAIFVNRRKIETTVHANIINLLISYSNPGFCFDLTLKLMIVFLVSCQFWMKHLLFYQLSSHLWTHSPHQQLTTLTVIFLRFWFGSDWVEFLNRRNFFWFPNQKKKGFLSLLEISGMLCRNTSQGDWDLM